MRRDPILTSFIMSTVFLLFWYRITGGVLGYDNYKWLSPTSLIVGVLVTNIRQLLVIIINEDTRIGRILLRDNKEYLIELHRTMNVTTLGFLSSALIGGFTLYLGHESKYLSILEVWINSFSIILLAILILNIQQLYEDYYELEKH